VSWEYTARWESQIERRPCPRRWWMHQGPRAATYKHVRRGPLLGERAHTHRRAANQLTAPTATGRIRGTWRRWWPRAASARPLQHGADLALELDEADIIWDAAGGSQASSPIDMYRRSAASRFSIHVRGRVQVLQAERSRAAGGRRRRCDGFAA
jgi:hypothetical protein